MNLGDIIVIYTKAEKGLRLIIESIIIFFIAYIFTVILSFSKLSFLAYVSLGLNLLATILQLVGVVFCGISGSKYFKQALILLIVSVIFGIFQTIFYLFKFGYIFGALSEFASIFITGRIVKGCGEVSKSIKVKKLSKFVMLTSLISVIISVVMYIFLMFKIENDILYQILSFFVLSLKTIHFLFYIPLLFFSYKTIK